MKEKSGYGCVLAMVAVPLLLVGGCVYVTNKPYSEGFRDGEIQKFSHKGLFRKSYEGDLALPGSGRGAGAIGNVWHFTVKDKGVAETLEKLPPFSRIRLHYSEYLWSWSAETNYRVTKVEVLGVTDTTIRP